MQLACLSQSNAFDSRGSESIWSEDVANLVQYTAGPAVTMTLSVPEQLWEIGPPRSDDLSLVSAACYEQDIMSTLLLGRFVLIWPTR